MKTMLAILAFVILAVVIFLTMNCGGDKTPNIYTFPNTHPVKVGSLYAWIYEGDTTIVIVESIDTACCIYFDDAKLIRIFDSPDTTEGG